MLNVVRFSSRFLFMSVGLSIRERLEVRSSACVTNHKPRGKIVFIPSTLSNTKGAGASIFEIVATLRSGSDNIFGVSNLLERILFFSQDVPSSGENLFFDSNGKD